MDPITWTIGGIVGLIIFIITVVSIVKNPQPWGRGEVHLDPRGVLPLNTRFDPVADLRPRKGALIMSDTGRRDGSGKVFGGKDAKAAPGGIPKKAPEKTAAESTAAYEAKRREEANAQAATDSTARYEAKRAAEAKKSNIAVDGEWGPDTTKALQTVLGVPADGEFGPQTIAAFQTKLGAPADGEWGPVSIAILQRALGVTDDGIEGPATVSAMQQRLNAGTLI